VAELAKRCGYDNVQDFASGLAGHDNLAQTIADMSSDLAKFSRVSGYRDKPDGQRDLPNENHWLILQHGLVLRNFALAMRQGDSGRVRVSLSYFTVWFQASGKFNYATETMHLTACLKRLWSDDMKTYWMENCLINPSGNSQGWMVCDYLGEYVVREVKRMMYHNVNEATRKFLMEYIAVQVMLFREVRKKMATETGAPTYGSHSSKVTTKAEVEAIASSLLQSAIPSFTPGRQVLANGHTETEATDLYGRGLKQLGTTDRIAKYVDSIERLNGLVDPDWVTEPDDDAADPD
jgi:hypothetical protein